MNKYAGDGGDGSAVAARMRNHIREHGLGPGDRLPTHRELSRILGVGPRRLREGLSILKQEGLVVSRRRAGTYVCAPSVQALQASLQQQLEWQGCRFEDLVRARASLESAAAAEAARARTARDMLEILDAIERIDAVPQASASHVAADEAFHLAVLRSTHNPALLVFGELIVGQFRRTMEPELRQALCENPGRDADHREILAALNAERPELARGAMYRHIMAQLKSFLSRPDAARQSSFTAGANRFG